VSNDAYKTVTGKVTTFVNKNSNSKAGMLLDGENRPWYNKKEPIPEGLGKGAEVELKINPSKKFYNVEKVKILREADQSAGSVSEGANSKNAQQENKGDKSASPKSSFQTQKSKDIAVKVATKLAVEHAGIRPGDNQAEHLDEVNELANGYKNIMQGLLKEGEKQ